jgi:hypothetical protein
MRAWWNWSVDEGQQVPYRGPGGTEHARDAARGGDAVWVAEPSSAILPIGRVSASTETAGISPASGGDPAVGDADCAVSVSGDAIVVGHDDRRRAATLHLLADQPDHLVSELGVE